MTDRNNWDKEARRLVESPFRLRFQLGGDLSNRTHPVPRFIQAFDRARHVAEAVFAGSQLVALVGTSIRDDEALLSGGDGFSALRDMGFDAPTICEWRAPRYRGDGTCWWKCFDIGNDRLQRDTLLRCSASAEMAVRPKAPATIYLINSVRGIMLHVYDDRGMDVYAALADALTETYVAFDGWLLEHDKMRMATVFGLGNA